MPSHPPSPLPGSSLPRRRAARGLALAGALLLAAAAALPAQEPLEAFADAMEVRAGAEQPVLHYTVRVDAADLTGYTVELRVRNAPDTLRLQMPVWAPGAYRVANFARYVRDFTVSSGGRTARVTRPDSSTWVAVVRGGEATVRYRFAYPNATAASTPNNRNFLQPTGGLLDGPATYVYVRGHKLAPAHVTFDLPAEWRIATGLVPTGHARTFFAASYDVLIDSPVLMGDLRVWPFQVDGVPHRVAYWPLPDATPFDTSAFVGAVQASVATARDIFGRLPYREYTFLYVDGAGGGLEHLNSTTIGAPSAALARDPRARTGVTSHEYFHTWNIKRLRPAVLGPFDYQQPVRTLDLWFAEGVTDYYADVIARRAGFVSEAEARDALAGAIASYLGNPASDKVSPQRSSWTAWDPPSVNGGYSISYYLQGALLGELLDVQIRDATDLRRGMDDVMRTMFARFGGREGYRSEDVLLAVNETCACDLQLFFERHVSGPEQIEWDRYLALLGWRAVISGGPAADSAGRPRPDLRAGVTGFGGIGRAGGAAGTPPRLVVPEPASAWARAGLVSGDVVLRVNGQPVTDGASWREALSAPQIGDVVRVDYTRGGERRSAEVTLTGYDVATVRLEDVPRVSDRMRRMRKLWMAGAQ